MTFWNSLLTVVCVFAICVGQLLFKQVGMEIQATGGWLRYRVLLLGGTACLIYAGATILWIYLLRTIELNRIYPFMALSFVLVPAMSWVVYSERITAGYALGAAFIVAGLLIITLAR